MLWETDYKTLHASFENLTTKLHPWKHTQETDIGSTTESCVWLCKIKFDCVNCKGISWGVYIFNILEIELLVLSWIFIHGFYV